MSTVRSDRTHHHRVEFDVVVGEFVCVTCGEILTPVVRGGPCETREDAQTAQQEALPEGGKNPRKEPA